MERRGRGGGGEFWEDCRGSRGGVGGGREGKVWGQDCGVSGGGLGGRPPPGSLALAWDDSGSLEPEAVLLRWPAGGLSLPVRARGVGGAGGRGPLPREL